MRVLHVNKYGWPKGGIEAYVARVIGMDPEVSGIESGLFASRPEGPAFVRKFDIDIVDFRAAHTPASKARAVGTVLWSRSAARALDAAVRDFQPDVVHLHGYAHHFSSSVVAHLRKRRVPTVATAHDYKLICPAYTAVRDGRDCFDCSRFLSSHSVTSQCLHGDLAWSSVALMEAGIVRARRLAPDLCVAPSMYVLDALKRSWIRDLSQLSMLRHPVEPSGAGWSGDGGYIMYVGRLSWEKGLDQLVTNACDLGQRLVVAGDGPERAKLERLAANKPGLVTFVGHVGPEVLAQLRRRCRAVIVPSTWPETACLSAIESAVDGVPLVLTDRGALPEILQSGALGVVLRSPRRDSLSAALVELDEKSRAYDSNRLEAFRALHSWTDHMAGLRTLYQDAIDGPRSAAR